MEEIKDEKPVKMSKALFQAFARTAVEVCLKQSNQSAAESEANKEFANRIREVDPKMAEMVDRVSEAQANLCRQLRETRAYIIERQEPQRG